MIKQLTADENIVVVNRAIVYEGKVTAITKKYVIIDSNGCGKCFEKSDSVFIRGDIVSAGELGGDWWLNTSPFDSWVKTTYDDFNRNNVGSPKISTIKAVRERFGLGLRESKDFVERLC